MDINHFLFYYGSTNEIEEPIGFDDLKTKIKRSDMHGMSVEVSVGSLEFYGEAYNIIKQAYDADIESQIRYFAWANGAKIYEGILDLSTYEETHGDYQSIKCKVGDVGAKTTFNNRTDTDVDLDSSTTIDGSPLNKKAGWNTIKIPDKHLKYTNKGNWSEYVTLWDSNIKGSNYSVSKRIVPDIVTTSEFDTFARDEYILQVDDDHDVKYGFGTKCDIKGLLILHVVSAAYKADGDVSGNITLNVNIMSGSMSVYTKVYKNIRSGDFYFVEISIKDVPINRIALNVFAYGNQTGEHSTFNFSSNVVLNAGYIGMTMYDNLVTDNVSAKMTCVHDALNAITGSISENALSVKSDWYGGCLSSWNKPSSTGGGHLKAITNGYKIRGLYTSGDTERNMPVSFKSMINSLNALDCIGWGFSREDGEDYVRVERWNWFYKDDVILNLSGANEITISVDTDHIYTDLQIGFKKYETSQQFNSIDSVHGERSLKNPIKSVSNKICMLCEFIGDTYCIEETRRAKSSLKESESFKYDENIFIFELGYKGSKDVTSSGKASAYIPNNLVSSNLVDRPIEQYNVQLTPRRCAERWRSYLFASSNTYPYRFISGKINYVASFQCNLSNSTASNYDEYLSDFMGGQSLVENAQLEYSKTIFKAENIRFKYPISLAEYNAIIDNPYGLIAVDGIFGWIKEMQYSFATGEADFTLIRKNS